MGKRGVGSRGATVLALAMLAACAVEGDAAGIAEDAAWPAVATAGAGGSEAAAGMLAATPATAQGRPVAPPPLDTSRLVPAQIVDQAGFGRPMPAMHLQVPAGWQSTGGVTWNDSANCYAGMLQAAWSAIGPDSVSVIEVMPEFAWQVAGKQVQADPCPVAAHRTAREFLVAAAQQSRPGAKILDYRDQPGRARLAEQRLEARMRALGQSLAPGQTRRMEAGSLLLAYPEQGIEMRETLSAVVSFVAMQGNESGHATAVISHRAPAGRLDLGLAERVSATLEPDPQWEALAFPRLKRNVQAFYAGQRRRIDEWHSRQMAIINARGMADRHAIRMRGNQEVAGIYSAIAANTSATNDGIHRRNLEAIGEYSTYVGTNNTTVQSSIHGGSQVFQSEHDPNQAYSTDAPRPNPPDDYIELQRIP